MSGPRLTMDLDEDVIELSNGDRRVSMRYFMPTGLLMFPIVKDPYMMALSKSAGRKYWFNVRTRQSVFECPPDAMVDFKTSFERRYLPF